MANRKRTNVVERIARRMPEMRDGECWVTTYSPNRDGYPQVNLDDGTNTLVHRTVLEIHNAQPIPDGMVVMHTCDNPGCFNPAHLVLGTQSDNIRDCVSKGRFSCHNAPKGAGSRSSQ